LDINTTVRNLFVRLDATIN